MTAQGWAREHEWEQVPARQAAAKADRGEAATAQPADDVPAVPVAPVAMPAPCPAVVVPAAEPEFADVDDDQELVLEELTREQVLDWRNRAADHQLAFDHIDRYGKLSALRLFTRLFVAQVQRLSGLHRGLRHGLERQWDVAAPSTPQQRLRSSRGQDLAGQVRLLKDAGCVRIYVEKTGTREKIRPECNAALAALRPADTLTAPLTNLPSPGTDVARHRPPGRASWSAGRARLAGGGVLASGR
ncbi:hypothetical protein AB0G74_15090 [Streptomyces sp. NPDC020875]|uniref:hypothetical protein n=1 Tax=Streptomyces sp. NPDC020875 TaxID=3154898 RepID=UPI0033E0FE4F